MKEVNLFISVCVYGPSWRSASFQILLTQNVELNLVQIIQDFFSYIESKLLSESFDGFNKNQTGTTPSTAEPELELTKNRYWFSFLAHR